MHRKRVGARSNLGAYEPTLLSISAEPFFAVLLVQEPLKRPVRWHVREPPLRP